jgi:hypothetical protein
MGMPAVATALILNKDMYNSRDPLYDVSYLFADEITASVNLLHQALDDDLIGMGFTPCYFVVGVQTATPYIIPDMLKLETTEPAGFPNGRGLPDQVIDITLALILLDLETHSVTTFADLPLNPAANDVAFPSTFPYLAPAH